jgi:DNA invertase Pin-like site-specific DNA recombinase
VSAVETVIGYLRCSTREQADSGLGLDAQRRTITAEAERRDWSVRWITDDGYTARNLKRPGIQEAMRALRRREASTLVVAKLDRLSRSLPDFAATLDRARRQKWALVALDIGVDMTTPNGRLVASIIAAVAEWESATIGARAADAMAEAKVRGVTFGRGRMATRGVVDRITSAREAGEPFSAIAAGLDGDGVPTPNGGRRWYPSTVARLYAAANREAVA